MYTTQNLAEFQSLDLSKVIEIINPQRTPFSSFLMQTGKVEKAESSILNWYEETLNTNSVVTVKEGAPAPTSVNDTTALLTNYTEILNSLASVSTTAQASNIVGVDDLMAREVNKKLGVMKWVLENRLIKGTKALATATTGQQMNGILNMVHADNVVTGAFSQNIWEKLLKCLYDSGTNDNMLCFIDDVTKSQLNNFISPQYFARDKFLGFDVDKYNSVYGSVSFILCPALAGTKSIFVLNPEYIKLKELNTFKATDMGITGNSIEKLLSWEGSLYLGNSKAVAKLVMP